VLRLSDVPVQFQQRVLKRLAPDGAKAKARIVRHVVELQGRIKTYVAQHSTDRLDLVKFRPGAEFGSSVLERGR
jgi:hypothetical protein